MKQACVECGKPFAEQFQLACDACGGLVDVSYDLANIVLPASENPYERYAPLLPLRTPLRTPPAARATPLVHARRLGAELGLSAVYLKDETVLPTRSTKDRMAAVALAYMHAHGVRSFCASSTGNSSTAFAHAITAYPDMHLYLFTAERFVPRVQHADHPQVTHFGLRGATFVEAGHAATRYAHQHGHTSEGGFFNPGRRQGLKLAFLEASEQIDRPIDWYVQAVSSAMGVYGVHQGAAEMLALGHIERLPRLLCVQQESCAPMAAAFADNADAIEPRHIVKRPDGIAEAILRGDPSRAYPYIRRIVRETGGTITAVSEREIRDARRLVGELAGIDVCFSAAAAVAGLASCALQGTVRGDQVVVINLTGADRGAVESVGGVRWE